MRWLVPAMLALVAAPPAASATDYPWCSTGPEVGTPICGYSSYEQCRASSRSCIFNPASPRLPKPAPTGRPPPASRG